MHPQIRQIIETMLFAPGRASIRLSSGEQTPFGRVLGRLYYNSEVMSLLSREERHGYPHNGGQHTLEIYCSPRDAVAFIEAMKETAEDQKFSRTPEEQTVVSQLSFISQEILGRKM